MKDFNYKYIYGHDRLAPFKEYSQLIINQIFEILLKTYDGRHSWLLISEKKKYYPCLMGSFEKWLARYCSAEIVPEGELLTIALNCDNKKIYVQAILDFVSGMTDRFAIKVFNELITY